MTVCSHCNPLWPVCHSDSTPLSISIFISLSLSSFFEFPFHPDWSKQMAAFQTRGGVCSRLLPTEEFFLDACRFMLAPEGSVGFWLALETAPRRHWVWFAAKLTGWLIGWLVDWLIDWSIDVNPAKKSYTFTKLNTKEYRNFKNIFDYLTINWVVRPLRTSFGNANSSNVRQSEGVEMGESQRGYLAAPHWYSGPSRAASNAPFKFDFGMFPISFCHSSLGN